MGGTREAGGRFLALQPTEASFKPLEVIVTHDLVAAVAGRRPVRQVMAAVRNMSATGRAFWRADSRKRFRVVGKIRCYSGCTRFRRRVRRSTRITGILDRMPLPASALRRSPWCVRRAKGVIVAFGRMSFCDGPFARLARHMIDGIKRLPWRGTHIRTPLLTRDLADLLRLSRLPDRRRLSPGFAGWLPDRSG